MKKDNFMKNAHPELPAKIFNKNRLNRDPEKRVDQRSKKESQSENNKKSIKRINEK